MSLRHTCLALAGALLIAGPAQAASITYLLNQGNDPEGYLPDGQTYATVKIDNEGTPGYINFTVTLTPTLTSIADANFGIDRFMFNSTNVLTAANVVGLPVGWAPTFDYNPGPPHLTGDGFGRFEIGLGMLPRQSPLTFSIDIAGDSIGDYAVLSTNSVEGNTYFALHVAGFLDQDPAAPLDPIDGVGLCIDDGQGNYTAGCNILTSAWFGGTAVVPVPAAVWLLGSALGVLGWLRRRDRS